MQRSDAFAALDRQHMAPVDDDAAAVAKRLQRVHTRGAARRIGDLPWVGSPWHRAGRSDGAKANGACRRSRRRDRAHPRRTGRRRRRCAPTPRVASDGALGQHGDAAQARPRARAHGARADGRHVDAHFLARLGPLDENAAARPTPPSGRRRCSDAVQHGVGASRRLRWLRCVPRRRPRPGPTSNGRRARAPHRSRARCRPSRAPARCRAPIGPSPTSSRGATSTARQP